MASGWLALATCLLCAACNGRPSLPGWLARHKSGLRRLTLQQRDSTNHTRNAGLAAVLASITCATSLQQLRLQGCTFTALGSQRLQHLQQCGQLTAVELRSCRFECPLPSLLPLTALRSLVWVCNAANTGAAAEWDKGPGPQQLPLGLTRLEVRGSSWQPCLGSCLSWATA